MVRQRRRAICLIERSVRAIGAMPICRLRRFRLRRGFAARRAGPTTTHHARWPDRYDVGWRLEFVGSWKFWIWGFHPSGRFLDTPKSKFIVRPQWLVQTQRQATKETPVPT